ncbi:AAA family ATPase [Microlunatus sp. GCM10028923]|uniref:AAA family ATPase n=1 Tax=Microlunatus sp. GCM10028923 TaxID=3273400 RepID=UPI00361C642C
MQDFVGRADELARVRERLARMASGLGQVVLLAGEPGIGKTRLARELVDGADAGLAIGWGRASEDEGCPPYWMIRQVYRSLQRPLPDRLGSPGSSHPEARFEAFEAVADDLREAAGPSGLVIVMDDLQWADAASLALLVHLARGIAGSPVLILAAYRDTEAAALTDVLAALAQEPVLTRIRLTGLTDAEVGEQLKRSTGAAVSGDLASRIRRRSGGNPFFVGELARLLGSTDDLPDLVVDAVRARLGRLGDSSRDLITVAAALGEFLDPSILAQVTGRPVPQVLSDLDDAATAGLIAGPGRWQFAHDLVRESARLGLSSTSRLTAHARLAEVLSARSDAAERVGEIAHHRLASLPIGDPELATEWAERAANEALGQLAWESAAELFQQANDTGADLAPADRSRLLCGAGLALIRAGNLSRGMPTLTAAAAAAREADDPVALGQTALAVEGVADPWGTFQGGAIAAEALAGLPAEDSPLRVRLLALQAGEAGFAGGPGPERISVEALAMAERVGDGAALRSALRARQMVRSGPDGVSDRLRLGDRMLALATAEHDHDAALWGRLWRYDALLMLGRIDEAEAELGPIRVLAESVRGPLAQWHSLRSQATIDLARGRFDEAITATRACLALVEAHAREHASLAGLPMTVLSSLAALTGRTELFPDAMFEVFERGVPPVVSVAVSVDCLRRGDLDRARRLYASADGPASIPITVRLPLAAAYVEVAAALGPPEHVRTAAALLREHPDLFVAGGAGALLVNGSVRMYLGMAAAADGSLDEAVRELRLAVEANERVGLPPFAALSRYLLGRVLIRRRRAGDSEEATALATAAAAAARAMGMAPLLSDAKALVAESSGRQTGPLTRREREVAGHLAEGLTNRQIAALLHLSERTVETHVQHVLTKLGLANRTLIATWVRDGMRTGSP